MVACCRGACDVVEQEADGIEVVALFGCTCGEGLRPQLAVVGQSLGAVRRPACVPDQHVAARDQRGGLADQRAFLKALVVGEGDSDLELLVGVFVLGPVGAAGGVGDVGFGAVDAYPLVGEYRVARSFGVGDARGVGGEGLVHAGRARDGGLAGGLGVGHDEYVGEGVVAIGGALW